MQRFLQQTKEDSKEEETREPSRWILEEIMGPKMEDQGLRGFGFEEETGLDESEGDALQRVMQQTQEDSKEEEAREPTKWMVEEFMDLRSGNLVHEASVFEEETSLGGYKADGEKEMFDRGRDWSWRKAEAETVNLYGLS